MANVNEGKISFEIESGKIGKIYFPDSKNNPRMIKTAFNIKKKVILILRVRPRSRKS